MLSGPPQDVSQTPIRAFLRSLRSNLETIEDVENALLGCLAGLGLVPSGFDSRRPPSIVFEEILNAIPTIQNEILTSILPIWFQSLKERSHLTLIKQFFCPSNFKDTVPDSLGNATGVETARNGLSNIITYLSILDVNNLGPRELFGFCLSMLQDIAASYPLDVVFEGIFLHSHPLYKDQNVLHQHWEDYIRAAASLPGKVANIVHNSKSITLDENLEYSPYFSSFCAAAERVLSKASQQPLTDVVAQATSYLLLKLINQGLLPSVRFGSTLKTSFFLITLPTIQRSLQFKCAIPTETVSSPYTEAWCIAIRGLPLLSQQTLIRSLFSSLDVEVGIDVSWRSLQQIRKGLTTINGLLGNPFHSDETLKPDDRIKNVVLPVLLSADKVWDLGLVRTIVYWIANPKASVVNEKGLSDVLETIMKVWTNPDHIRHSLYSRQRYVTSLFLITLTALPQSSKMFQRLSLSPPFISSITTFLSHQQLAIRQCGMLAAEMVAERCNQNLNFGGWDGDSEHLEWIRFIRGSKNDWIRSTPEPTEDASPLLSAEEDTLDTRNIVIPKVITDSDDDSLSGYSSSHGSSRPPSPTMSDFEEMEKDPTLRVGRSKPIPKPVYLAQLVSLFRKTSTDDKDTAETIEVILNSAELLIRRKKGFGYELEENAVQLTISLVMLRDNYELRSFTERRQSALIALVECCPKRAAQTLVEQFFTNQYSTTDRIMMLTALVFGAQKLAGLADFSPTYESPNSQTAFPSKLLPPALHNRYASQMEIQQAQIQKLLGGMTRLALDKSKNEAEDTLIASGSKEVSRTRMLRLGSANKQRGSIKVLETTPPASSRPPPIHPPESFISLAAEYFIMPLVNHMWLYLRDTDTRVRKDVAGTGIILDASVLSHFLSTLAILVHAARNSPAFLNIIAPASIDIAVTLGSRRIEAYGEKLNPPTYLSTATPATILTAAMELALLGLDASSSLDDGQTLASENTALLMALSTWAAECLNVLDKGHHLIEGGGGPEGKLNAVTAAVVIRIERIKEKWGRMM